ncbi:hypothetical protein [Citreicoccus inhibens]|uniref:hypothetical protein n=1 Tax=Citreicoccus inhibens TaxID=2849499 RepID=UPI001F311DF7|nr:hypothetical protein [Citreicoccus inhibens]
MKHFIDLVKKYHPGFSQRIEPADKYDISTLERRAGSLPGAYRRFLETMGTSMGDVELAEASLSIEGALNAYTLSWLKDDRYILFGGDNGLSSRHWFLDRKSPHGADDCMVVRRVLAENNPPEASTPQYVGLEEFL